MNTNYSQNNLFFLIFSLIILCFNAPVTHGETQAAREIQESEEFKNSTERIVQNDYRNGFGELLKFINSLNDTLTSLNAKLATQDTALNALSTKMEAEFIALNKRLSDNEKIEVGCKALNESISVPETTQKAETDQLPQNFSLQFKTTYDLNKWEAFDSLIRTQAKEIKTGKSFNGSTLSDIKSRAKQVGYNRRYTAIVFVNHLDEAIDDFTIYQHYNNNFIYTPLPNSVPGRTQEVFTFAPLESYGGSAYISFSYAIPTFNIRVAAISWGGVGGVGLAFVPIEEEMETYYELLRGIKGSTVWECCDQKDRNLSVGYKNLYARIFAHLEGNSKSTLRIELIKLPLDG